MQNSTALRALFDSHDTVELGHLRRTLVLANGLSERLNGLNTLIVTGSAMAHGFRLQPSLDYVKLPSVSKVGDENCRARTLDAPFEQMLNMRRELIRAAARTFQPNILFIDNVPLGLKGEIVATLQEVRATNPDCRVFLSLRDIIDAPERVVPLWRRLGVYEALHEYYDGICVYGHSEVFDVAEEYEFPDGIRAKTRYCGYLPRPVDRSEGADVHRRLGLSKDDLLLVATFAGGSDGGELVDVFLKALPFSENVACTEWSCWARNCRWSAATSFTPTRAVPTFISSISRRSRCRCLAPPTPSFQWAAKTR